MIRSLEERKGAILCLELATLVFQEKIQESNIVYVDIVNDLNT